MENEINTRETSLSVPSLLEKSGRMCRQYLKEHLNCGRVLNVAFLKQQIFICQMMPCLLLATAIHPLRKGLGYPQ